MALETIPVDVSQVAGSTLPALTYENSGLWHFIPELLDPRSGVNKPLDGTTPPIERIRKAGLDDAAEIEAVLIRGIELAKQLRHARVIFADDAVRWIAATFMKDPKALEWHIRRLDGVSASSAWAYIAESRGSRSYFHTARDLDMQRLMKMAPVETNWPMFRGTHLEPLARALFYRRNANTFSPYPEAAEAVRAQRGIQGNPWMIGNPDDIARYLRAEPGAPVVVDFKCPSQPVDKSDDPPMDYTVQLHFYAMLSAEAGHVPRGIVLSHLYVADDIAQLWARMLEDSHEHLPAITAQAMFALDRKLGNVSLDVQTVPIDRHLVDEIITVCSAADRRVLEGRVAPWPKRGETELDPVTLQAARAAADHLAYVISVRKETDAVESLLKSQLQQIYAGVDTRISKPGISSISLAKSYPLRPQEAIDHLVALGKPIEGLRNEVPQPAKVVYDTKAILKALEQADIPAQLFEGESYAIQLSRVKSGPVAAELEAIRNRAIELTVPMKQQALLIAEQATQPSLTEETEPDGGPHALA